MLAIVIVKVKFWFEHQLKPLKMVTFNNSKFIVAEVRRLSEEFGILLEFAIFKPITIVSLGKNFQLEMDEVNKM